MIDYEKVAVIVLRSLACYLLLFSILEWGIIASGVLLVQFGFLSRGTIAFEARLVASVFYLFGGLVLLGRSKQLAHRMVEGLTDE
jgi:hypothetical protein